MIYLFTDFGVNGPYVGQMKSVLSVSSPPESVIIDLMHDAPAFNPRASAYMLSALMNYMEEDCIVIAVVDPGVGNPLRKPIMIKANNRWFIGPDNGLFAGVIKSADSVECYEIIPGKKVSKSFHGRDVFAPAAGELANGRMPNSKLISQDSLQKTEYLDELAEVIYLDQYGNSMTGLRADTLKKSQIIKIDNFKISHADTFSSVPAGSLFWYENSIGLVEVSKNSGSAAKQLNIGIGKAFDVLPEATS